MPDDRPIQERARYRLRRVVAPGVDELAAPHATVPSAGTASPGAGADIVSADAPGGQPATALRLPGPNPFDPGRRGVRALAAVAVVVVLVAASLAWRARPRPTPVSADPGQAATMALDRKSGTGHPDSGEVGPTASGPADLVVAVTGKVRRPGLVRLPTGARVADAVQAAGGALPGADTAFLNLARRVSDGELILVGVTAPPGASGAELTGSAGGRSSAGGGSGGARAAGSGPSAPAVPVNLNTATTAQLDTLPGVGPVLAQRIVDFRDRHGSFRAVGDLRQVDGIGDARYEQLRPLVTV